MQKCGIAIACRRNNHAPRRNHFLFLCISIIHYAYCDYHQFHVHPCFASDPLIFFSGEKDGDRQSFLSLLIRDRRTMSSYTLVTDVLSPRGDLREKWFEREVIASRLKLEILIPSHLIPFYLQLTSFIHPIPWYLLQRLHNPLSLTLRPRPRKWRHHPLTSLPSPERT